MVVVVAEGGADAGAHGWGTSEELLLGCAVERYGCDAWDTVADALRTRCPCAFSPEDCEAQFAEIQLRYPECYDLVKKLRQQRLDELKRVLEESEKSIGALQSVIESLKNSKCGDGTSDCRTTHTESCSHSGNIAGTNSSSKELSRDRSSAASFTEEASNCQKSQLMQRCDTDSNQTNNTSTEKSFLKVIDENVCTNYNLFWGSKKQRGRRVGRIVEKTDASSRDSEPTSTVCMEMEGSSKGCKEHMKKGLNLKAPNVESGTAKKGLKTPNMEPAVMKKGLKTRKSESGVLKNGLKTPKQESGVIKNVLKTPKLESGLIKNSLKTAKLESGVIKNSLKSPEVEPGVSEIEKEKEKLTDIVKSIYTQGDCLMLQHQVDILKKRATYKTMIRRHMDFRILHSKIKSGEISSTKELLRDILLLANNVIAFYPKATLEHMAAVELRDLACKTVNQSADFSSRTTSAPSVKKSAQVIQPGRHGPGDAKGNKVSSRDATVTAKQGEGKEPCSDKPPEDNLKTVQSEPPKKRGVGRPPKSGPLKRSAQAPEDSPSRGRKRIRRGP